LVREAIHVLLGIGMVIIIREAAHALQGMDMVKDAVHAQLETGMMNIICGINQEQSMPYLG